MTKTLEGARPLGKVAGYAAWASADPGLHFNTTMNDWRGTCGRPGDIRASKSVLGIHVPGRHGLQPCVYERADVLQHRHQDLRRSHPTSAPCRLWTLVLEISVMMAQFPSRAIAELSYEFRTLGLGFANTRRPPVDDHGSSLRQQGRPLALCGALTAVMDRRGGQDLGRDGGRARHLPGFKKNAAHMHAGDPQPPQRCNGNASGYEAPRGEPCARFPRPRLVPASQHRRACDESPRTYALALGEANGFRNAQTTVLAPTGTIGLVMDCDTTGIEPDFALVKFKKLAGGGTTSRSSTRRCRRPCARSATAARDRRDRGLCCRSRLALQRAPASTPSDLAGQGLLLMRPLRKWKRPSQPHSTSSSPSTSGPLARTSSATSSASGWRPLPRRISRPAHRARPHQARDRGRERAHLPAP